MIPEKHISDTLKAGDGLCNLKVVQMVEEGKRLHELINWGINFDKSKIGDYDLGLEGGHSNIVFYILKILRDMK